MRVTSEDLRLALFNAMQALHNREISVAEAHAFSKLATNMINSVSVEIQYFKVMKRYGVDGQSPCLTLNLTPEIEQAGASDDSCSTD